MTNDEIRELLRGESSTALVQSLSRAERARIVKQGDLSALLSSRGDTTPWHPDAIAAAEQLLIDEPALMQDYPEFK